MNLKQSLKKLSRSQGRILKLIHRQTGTTTYELVKNTQSGWKVWSTAASMFDINLKSEFVPYESNEDF
jgi:hypothetical protein